MDGSEARSGLLEMIGGYRATALVTTAARLGLADLLAEGPAGLGRLAELTGARPDRLLQLLRALVAVGLLESRPDGAFALTPLGEPLRTDLPDSLHSAAVYFGAVSAPSFDSLYDLLHTDGDGFRSRHGTDFYGFLGTHSELAAHYNAVIAVEGLGDALAEAYDFGTAASVADIGGGNGTTLAELLLAHPHLTGTLQEIPHVMEEARDRLADPGLAGRATAVPGSFLDGVVPGADRYLLVRVLPNWGDEEALRILRHFAAVMTPGARLLIVDAEMPEQVAAGAFAPIGDLHALVHFGGRLRSRSELAGLLSAAGLRFSGAASVPVPGRPQWSLSEVEVDR
ncbi:methyltransferase [Kitasatospora sp. NPDC004289]